jgi:serine/threonine protein kinase
MQVCDFGLSAVKENETEKLQDTDSVPGTPLWMAPEGNSKSKVIGS